MNKVKLYASKTAMLKRKKKQRISASHVPGETRPYAFYIDLIDLVGNEHAMAANGETLVFISPQTSIELISDNPPMPEPPTNPSVSTSSTMYFRNGNTIVTTTPEQIHFRVILEGEEENHD